jgi:hypothetical protein
MPLEREGYSATAMTSNPYNEAGPTPVGDSDVERQPAMDPAEAPSDVEMKTLEASSRSGHSAQLSKTKSIAEQLPLAQEILFVGVVVTAQFTAQAGFSQMIPIIFIIGDSFGITATDQLSWLIAGFSLTVGTFILIGGRLGDLYGYKRMFIIGMAWFSLWSMIGGLAVYSNGVLFIFARVFQGMGPALTLPNALALLGVSYAPGRRKDMVSQTKHQTLQHPSRWSSSTSHEYVPMLTRTVGLRHLCGNGTYRLSRWRRFRSSFRPSMVAVGILGHRHNAGDSCSSVFLRHTRPAEEVRCRTHVAARKIHRPRSWWCGNGHHRSDSVQLCMEPGSYRRLG